MKNTSRIKVLFIDAGYGYGGQSSFLYYFLRYISKNDFKPIVAFYHYNNSPETKKIENLGIPVYFIDSDNNHYLLINSLINRINSILPQSIADILGFLTRLFLIEIAMIWKIIRLMNRTATDLVVLNNDLHYHFVGTIGAKIMRIPCICRKAGGIGEHGKIKKILTPCIDLFIAISKATARDQLLNHPYTKRLAMVYEGIDLKGFNSHVDKVNKRTELGIPPSKIVVGNVSRFAKGKGQMEFLDAAAIVAKNFPDVFFLLVGDGEMMEDLQMKTIQLNLTDLVHFTGWRSDVPEIIEIIDIFVHCPTTWLEGLGIANLEALAMSKPAIVSDNGGLPDVVIDGSNGFVVPVGNIHKLAESISKLVLDGELRRKFGTNAKKRVESNFNIEINVKEYESLFKDVINRARQKRIREKYN
jgi:glycosyltransferase involved in cell wall biosynthesis